MVKNSTNYNHSRAPAMNQTMRKTWHQYARVVLRHCHPFCSCWRTRLLCMDELATPFEQFWPDQTGRECRKSGLTDRDSPLITVPVAIIAGAWAVAQATPLLMMSLWRSAKGYMPVGSGRSGGWMSRSNAPYTSRGAFSARRQDYSHVVADEDELLGDDLEDGEDT